MSARARRPSAPPTTDLLNALGEARRLALQLAHAEVQYGSPRYRLCDAVRTAIDDLAADVTGEPAHFAAKPHGGPSWNMTGRPPKP